MTRNILIAILVSALASCVNMPAPKYQPGIANTQALMHAGQSKIAVDKFDAAKGVNNTSLSVRGSQLTGGSDGTFSTYLHDALQSELQTAGRYDPAAPTQLSGTLTVNQLDGGGISIGKARISVRFVLTRQQTSVYDKQLTADHQWESSFIGAVAIPAAMQNYPTAVQKLIGLLFSDPDFIKASNEGLSVGH